MAGAFTLSLGVDDRGDIRVAATELRRLAKEAANAAKASDRNTTATEKNTSAQKANNKSLLNQSSAFKVAGHAITRFTLPLAAAGAAALKFGNDLNSGLGQVQTLIPDTGQRIYELRDAVRDTAVESGKNFSDLTEGLFQTISAFQDSAETVERFNAVTNAAIAGGASVKSSLELLSAVTKGYDDTTAAATERVSDLAFEALRLGQTTFPELASSMQNVTAIASNVGISQEELFTSFATLTGVTGNADRVSTQLASTFAALMNPSEQLTRLLNELGFASGRALIEEEGLISTLNILARTAEKSGIPLQAFTRRKEALIAITALAGAQQDDFIQKLGEVQNAYGATDRAVEAVTEGINQYGFSLQQTGERLAVIGSVIHDTVIPVVATLGEAFASAAEFVFSGSAAVDSVIVGLGALTLAIGPLLIAFGGVLRLLQLYTQVIGASTAATYAFHASLGVIGVVLLAVSTGIAWYTSRQEKARVATEEHNAAIRNWQTANEQALTSVNNLRDAQDQLQRGAITQLLIDYPELVEFSDEWRESNEGLIKTLREINILRASRSVESVFAQELEPITEMQSLLASLTTEISSVSKELTSLGATVNDDLSVIFSPQSIGNNDPLLIRQLVEDLDLFSSRRQSIIDNFDAFSTAFLTSFNPQIAERGIALTMELVEGEIVVGYRRILEATQNGSGSLVSGVTLTPAQRARGIKTWEEWFAELSNVSIERFNALDNLFDEETGKILTQNISGQGEVAANAFVQDLLDGIARSQLLEGADFDLAGAYDSVREKTNTLIASLLAIDPALISNSKAFNLLDQSIQGLRASSEELRQIQISTIIEQSAIDDFNALASNAGSSFDELKSGSDKVQDLIDTLEGLGATREELQPLFDTLYNLGVAAENTFEGANASALNFANTLRRDLFEAFKEIDGISAQSALSLSTFTQGLVDGAITAGTEAIGNLGKQIVNAAQGTADFGSVLAGLASDILKLIPTLAIQAGLNLLASPNKAERAIGIGLIAGGLVGKLTQGITEQIQATSSNGGQTPQANATGNAYSASSNIIPFASGGTFTNSIVSTPTNFRFAQGTGLMGEAGPEAIIPLSRTTSGDLGVKADGLGSNVNITIVNNTGAQVSTQENETPDGTEIQVIIGDAVNSQIASGTFDRSLSGRYGLQLRGVG